MIIIVTQAYSGYYKWLKSNFPYWNPSPRDKEFANARPDNFDNFRGLDRLHCYINVDNIAVPDWFDLKFKEVVLVRKENAKPSR